MEFHLSYRFGSFRLETKNRLLVSKKNSVQLPLKEYLLLLYFLQNQGQLVTRQEIFKAIWPNRVVEDVALRFAINYLRRSLRDDSKSPKYIQTICKGGYLFLPIVEIESMVPDNRVNFTKWVKPIRCTSSVSL